MKTSMKRLTWIFGALLALALLTYAVAWWRTEQSLAQRWQLPAANIEVGGEPEQIARGEHLAHTRGCTGCHGPTLGGTHVIDAGPVMQIHAPNLTQGGVLPKLDPTTFEHAVRHAVGRDGQPLLIMPARDYMLLSNQDVAALYAYLSQVPAQAGAQPPSRIGPVGRVLHLFGALPFADAVSVDHVRASRGDAAPSVADVAAYGGYVAQVCKGCHGNTLAGGPMLGQPPGVPPPANLTPHTSGLGSWSEADFLTAMRTGKRPDGSSLNDFMPWRDMGQMDETELHALWVYLRSVPPTPTGGRAR